VAVTVSTHVLDTEVGEPVGGLKVGLFDGEELLSLQETNDDGRIPALFEGEPGEYRLVFFVDGGFFDKVELTLGLFEDRHYHVPLLISSYACASYRGS
jgi:5-hydroxyisourate hydrolase